MHVDEQTEQVLCLWDVSVVLPDGAVFSVYFCGHIWLVLGYQTTNHIQQRKDYLNHYTPRVNTFTTTADVSSLVG